MKLKTLLAHISGDNTIHLQNWGTNERKVFMNGLRHDHLTDEELNLQVLIIEGVDNRELYISITEKEED